MEVEDAERESRSKDKKKKKLVEKLSDFRIKFFLFLSFVFFLKYSLVNGKSRLLGTRTFIAVCLV